jgi:hypothetical protein
MRAICSLSIELVSGPVPTPWASQILDETAGGLDGLLSECLTRWSIASLPRYWTCHVIDVNNDRLLKIYN